MQINIQDIPLKLLKTLPNDSFLVYQRAEISLRHRPFLRDSSSNKKIYRKALFLVSSFIIISISPYLTR